MKNNMNILIYAARYPEYDNKVENKATPFLHIYAKEWTRMGHRVLVIQNKPIYPEILYRSIKVINKTPLQTIATKQYEVSFIESEDNIYSVDDITIYRKKITKILPRLLCSQQQIDKEFIKSVEFSENEKNFKPDIILTDFFNPSLFMGVKAKEYFKVPLVSILHITDFMYAKRKFTSNKILKALNNVDCIAYRSNILMKKLNILAEKEFKSIPFFTGVPNEFSYKVSLRKKVRKVCVASRLIKRKNIDSLINAFEELCKYDDAELVIIGDGQEFENLNKLAKTKSYHKKIKFVGKVTREEVFKYFLEADCFAMLSKDETFGMVYVEAMRCGCITIGSRNEGIDGIIKNNYNGYLCDAGSEKELREVFINLSKMDEEQIQGISAKAIELAKNMTDYELAKNTAKEFECLINKR